MRAFGPCAALIFAALLLIPFPLWGNPYPAAVVRYWTICGALAILATLALVTSRLDERASVRRMVATVRARAALTPRQFAALVGASCALLSATAALYVFRGFATTSDEIAQLWHARILLSGRWTLPVDPNPEFFSLDTVVDAGRWYSQFPIGGPLFLAIGVLLGVPWLPNALFAGASAVAVYHFARRAFGETQGRWGTVLFCLTPMLVFMGGTWMNHVPTLFFGSLALAALVSWDAPRTAARGWTSAALIGLAVGMMAITRPLDAVVFAAVIGAFQVVRLSRDRGRAAELVVQAAAGLACMSVLLFANHRSTGGVFRFGYDVLWGPGHRVGFHLDPYGAPHTLARGLDYAVSYIGALNFALMYWPVPAFALLVLGLAAARGLTRWDALLIALLGAQVAAYAAYWYRGELLGPRFLVTVLPAVVLLLARAPAFIGARFGDRAGRGAVVLLVLCTLVAWLAPASTVGIRGAAMQARGQRRSLKLDIVGAVRDANAHNALVFLSEPFSARLARRLWAVGVPRGAVPNLLETRDACTLLAAIEVAESAVGAPAERRIAPIMSLPIVTNFLGSSRSDPAIHIAGPESLTPLCETEINADAGRTPVPFGAGLIHEPIDAAGRIDGDVIYVADLGAHNEVLRRRFAGRTWYRISAVQSQGELRAVLRPYEDSGRAP